MSDKAKEQRLDTCTPGDRFAAVYSGFPGLKPWVQLGTLVRIGATSCTVLLDNTGKQHKIQGRVFRASPEPVHWAGESPVRVIGKVELNDYWKELNGIRTPNPIDAKTFKNWREPDMAKTKAVATQAPNADANANANANLIKAYQARLTFANKKLQAAVESDDTDAIVAESEKIEALKQEAASNGVVLDAPTEAVTPEVGTLRPTQTLKQKQANKVPATPRAKKEKVLRPCLDGCGAQVAGNFQMGHDAKLKSLLKKIEKGEGEPGDVPEVCQDLVKFKKGELIEEKDAQGKVTNSVQQWICTAAPVKFPGRDDMTITTRKDAE